LGCFSIEDEGLVDFMGAWGKTGNPHIELTSYGIEYCESDSHSMKGEAVINIINSSTNANIVHNSPNTNIIQSAATNDLKNKLVAILVTT
jgi:hypothetical protein